MKLKNRQLLRAWLLGLLLIGLSGPIAMACRIPVFRYALERWAPDPFEITVSHASDLNSEQQQALDKLRKVGLHQANVRLLPSKPSGDKQKSSAQTAGQDSNPASDARLMTVRLTKRGERTRHIWQAPLSLENVDILLNSPQRKQISQRLLNGESAVWVLIESGDKEQDDRVADLLKTELEKMAERIKLPDQSELEAEAEFIADTSVELRIDFSVVRVSRKDPKEAAFLAMLLASESDLAEYDEPIVIPVYGRGRTYYALVGKGIRSELIAENCRFICGDCSCQVKEENPGSDLLFSVDWAAKVRGSAIPEKELPPLQGIGGLEIIDLGTVEDMKAENQAGQQQIAAISSTDSSPELPQTATNGESNTAAVVEPDTTNAATVTSESATKDQPAGPASTGEPEESGDESSEEPRHAPTDRPTTATGDDTSQASTSSTKSREPADASVPPTENDRLSVSAQAADSEPTTQAEVEDTGSITTEMQQTKSTLFMTLLAIAGIAAAVVLVVGYLMHQ